MALRRTGMVQGAIGLLMVAVVGCSPTPTTGPSPTALASPFASSLASAPASPGPSPTAVPAPSPGGPTAITPASNQILVSVHVASDVGPPGEGRYLYADGSLVDATTHPIRVYALSDAGIEQVMDAFRSSGLFTTSRAIPAPPVDHGFTSFRVTFDGGNGPVTVAATNTAGDVESRALVALAEAFRVPETWIGADGWVDGRRTAHPYRPLTARITSELVSLASDGWVNPARTLDRVNWPLTTSPIDLGDPVGLGGDRALRCGLMSGADADAVRDALEHVAVADVAPHELLSTWYLWTTKPGLLKLTVRPYLPHETGECVPAELPDAPSLASAPRPSLADILLVGLDGWKPLGEPYLIVQMHAQGNRPAAHVSYYADGSVVVTDPPAPLLGYGVLRLSERGQVLLAEHLDGTGLLGASWTEPIPDDESIDVNVLARDPTSPGEWIVLNASDRGADPTADAIMALGERLVDPRAWLPADAWVDGRSAMLPYRPRSIEINIEIREMSVPGEELERAPSVHGVVWPLSGTLETFGRLDPQFEPTKVRVATISPEEAIAILRALSGAGLSDPSYAWLRGSAPQTYVNVSLRITSGEMGI